MDTNKVVVTLLVFAIVLSVATVAFQMLSGQNDVVITKTGGADTATVALYVQGNERIATTEGADVGLYVESGQ